MSALDFMRSWRWDRLPKSLQIANWAIGIPLVIVWMVWQHWEVAATFVALWIANAVSIWRRNKREAANG